MSCVINAQLPAYGQCWGLRGPKPGFPFRTLVQGRNKPRSEAVGICNVTFPTDQGGSRLKWLPDVASQNQAGLPTFSQTVLNHRRSPHGAVPGKPEARRRRDGVFPASRWNEEENRKGRSQVCPVPSPDQPIR